VHVADTVKDLIIDKRQKRQTRGQQPPHANITAEQTDVDVLSNDQQSF